jgi:acyl-coenzyme A synthetase/AMP-(fatty) acid ligase
LTPLHPDGVHPRRLIDFLRRERVTVWHATAEALAAGAAADVVSPGDLTALRHVSWWTGGVSAPVSYWTRRVGHTRFTSLYGGPEAATVTAHHTWRDGSPVTSGTPLGDVCPGQEVVILDDQLEPVATDMIGDIWIRGLSLGPGYWGNTSATAEAFRGEAGGAGLQDRMWRSGDRGRRGPDGLLYLVGPEAEETWRGAAPSPTATSGAALESGAGA